MSPKIPVHCRKKFTSIVALMELHGWFPDPGQVASPIQRDARPSRWSVARKDLSTNEQET